jgi:predicted enzyme related to lactoylglutathione lyase
MVWNRSVPTNTVLPHLFYADIPRAIAWLTEAFGFREHYRYGDPVSGAQVHLGEAWIMLKRASTSHASPQALGHGTQSLTVLVDDVDGHFARAKEAGARIVEDLHETVYGERQYGAEDLEGHRWLFSRHARDLSPEEWGAALKEGASKEGASPIPSKRLPSFCYLEIPAIDVAKSVSFYEAVFGWNIRHRETGRPSFDDASGDISGAWVTGRDAAHEGGLLPYIRVESIEASLAMVVAQGGEAVKTPFPDHVGGTSWIATFRDPAGNLLGLYQENVP